MTVNELLVFASNYNYGLIAFFCGLPLLAFVASYVALPTGSIGAAHYFLSIVIYLASIPGMFAATLLFYALLITGQNLLEVNVVIYFLPIASMGLVFFLIGRKTEFERLPGFGRLSGLMLLLVLVCVSILFLYRLRFVIGFFASVESLLAAGVVLFALFKWATAKVMGKRDPTR